MYLDSEAVVHRSLKKSGSTQWVVPRGPQYSDKELLDELRRLARLKGRTPIKRDMTEEGKHAHRTYHLRFGSWSAAVQAAGFSPMEKGDDYAERPDACLLYDRREGARLPPLEVRGKRTGLLPLP